MDIPSRILSKSAELFMRYGIKRVTMDEIAVHLGISKKTIYQYYSDKNELVKAMASEHITTSEERCKLDLQKAENAVHEIFLTTDMVQEMMAKLNPVFVIDVQRYYPEVFSQYEQHKKNFVYKCIKKNLEWGIEEGLYRSNLDPEVIAKLRIETLYLPFNEDVFPSKQYKAVDLELTFAEYYLYGISTPKGQQLIEKYKNERKIK